MNGVELTNMLPHMKENLRNQLFHNASTALINAGIRLQHVNNDFDEQNFGLETQDQIEITIQRHGPHQNVDHIIPNYFTQEINHFGYGTNGYVYKVKWQLSQNLDNVEYVEMFSYNQGEKVAVFTQNIRHETNDGNILAVYQRRIQHYNIL
uniref:Uncharacterized protein n=1 Tax=Meloidogyne javanica TaxID=6303 RepID=A0A915LW71_MELJA